jgi:hypothetical protein
LQEQQVRFTTEDVGLTSLGAGRANDNAEEQRASALARLFDRNPFGADNSTLDAARQGEVAQRQGEILGAVVVLSSCHSTGCR